MNKWIRLMVAASLAAAAAQAQSWNRDYPRHNFTLGLGVASPGGDLKPVYSKAFAWSINYGYRPLKYLQLDIGHDGAYNSAGVNDWLDTSFGSLRIRDYQLFIPVGGRVVLPLGGGRAELFGGGGGLYGRYTEMLRQPSDYIRVECPACLARDGWGSYALAGANVALDRGKHIRLGATVKVYNLDTTGSSVGAVPPARTHDRWTNTFVTLGYSF